MLPLVLLNVGVLGLGMGLWMSVLTARYRDLSQVGSFFTQVLLYATPVVYPFSLVEEGWRWAFVLNPMTMNVELFRLGLLGEGSVELGFVLFSVLISWGVMLSGMMVFGRVEKTFLDTV